MFKRFKNKLIALMCLSLLAASLPITLAAEANASFTFFSVDRTSTTVGQTVNFTIRTAGANFVFADVGGTAISATSTGQQSWTLSVNPAVTGNVTVHANTTNDRNGSATITVPITVAAGGGTAHIPTAPTGQQHQIFSIQETEAPAANMVTLTIVTDDRVNDVWISESGRYILGTRTGTSGNQSTWTVTYRPSRYVAHTVQVSANHAYVLDNRVATQTVQVNLTAPFVPQIAPAIQSTSLSQSTINDGARTTLTVRTNLDVEFVWAEVDGRRVNLRRGTATAHLRSWTVEIRPDRTQTIPVFANHTDTSSGAVTDSVRVTVRDDRDDGRGNPRIIDVSRTRVNINDSVWIEIETNSDVTHVWAMVDGSRRNADRIGSGSGNRRWEVRVEPNTFEDIIIHANNSSSTAGAVTRRITVN